MILLGRVVPVVLALLLPLGGWAAAKSTAPKTSGTSKPFGVSRNPYLGAIVIDAKTGRVLFEDQADAVGYPASVLKLMDLLIIQEKIKEGELSLQDRVPVSAKAAETGESQVWLAQGEVFSVEDLLYALMIKSANDAAVALAEKVAGSTDEFVALMNHRARELGMRSTRFTTVNGLPPGRGKAYDKTTARDLTILCRELLKYPGTLRYTSTRQRPFRQNVPSRMVLLQTHNHLLARVEGCDGLKTGYTAAAGFSIAATASRNGQRVIAVVLGSIDSKTRDSKAATLIDKGFAALAKGQGTAAAPATRK